MKAIFILLISVLLFGCGKDYCTDVLNLNGDKCCVKCFRSEDKWIEWFEERAGQNYDCDDLCN